MKSILDNARNYFEHRRESLKSFWIIRTITSRVPFQVCATLKQMFKCFWKVNKCLQSVLGHCTDIYLKSFFGKYEHID